MKQYSKGKQASIPSGIAIGVVCSVFSSLILCAIVAAMLDKEVLSEANIGYGVMAVLLISSCIGSVVSQKRINRKRLIISATTAFLYLCSQLLTTAILFEGQYQAITETASIILCGNILPIFMIGKSKKKGRGWKKRPLSR